MSIINSHRSKGTTIQKLTYLFFAAWLIIALTIWLTTFQSKKDQPSLTPNSAASVLLKEAQLVEFFCLSKIPPTGGMATVPRAWEDALKSEIKLVDNVGELSSLSPEISDAAATIKQLQPGGHFAVSDPPAHTRHHLVYRSSANPNFMLSITKDEAGLATPTKSGGGQSGLWMMIARSAVAAFLVTLAAQLIIKPSLQSA